MPGPEPAPAAGEERRAAVERIVQALDGLMQDIALAHAHELVEVRATMPQAKVLYLVHAEPDLRMSELAARLGVSISTVSGLVDRMVEQGYLLRRDDPADRRHVILRLTALGTDQLDALRELNSSMFAVLLADVDDDGLAIVERAVDILAAAADRSRRDRVPGPAGAGARA